jgi:hypothetical protein
MQRDAGATRLGAEAAAHVGASVARGVAQRDETARHVADPAQRHEQVAVGATARWRMAPSESATTRAQKPAGA